MNVDIGTSEQHMLTKAILKKKIAWHSGKGNKLKIL